MSYIALQMSKKNTAGTISDLRYVNSILKKVSERDSRLIYERIGEIEDLIVVEIGEAP